MKLITVIYPIFGNFDQSRLETAVVSAINQKYANLRILVSEQNDKPLFASTANKLGIDYIFSCHKKSGNSFYIGQSRNNALRLINDGLVYMNDSDIVFMDKNYLQNISSIIGDNKILLKPSLIHLREKEVAPFINDALNDFDYTIKRLKFPNDYIASFSDEKVNIEFNTYKNRLFFAYPDHLQKYSNPEERVHMAPIIWNETVHQGAILANIESFKTVGGYCESYRGWGYEDTDIIWKLKSIYAAEGMPKEPDLRVIHLDHTKPYFNPIEKESNKKIFQTRKNSGADSAIVIDKNNFDKTHDG